MTEKPTVLITGCSEGGIGYHLAKGYNAKGYHVFATARKVASMKGLSELGVETLQLDVTDADSVKAARDHVSSVTGGKLDILVNNAGQPCPGAAVEVTIEAAQQVFDTNFFGVMRMCQEFVDLLIMARGQILNIGSVTGVFPLPFSAAYNASKAALAQYSDTLRIEMEPFGVNVTTVVTGTVITNIWNGKDPESLEPSSRYYPINDQYKARRANEAGARGGTSVEEYSKWFVEQTANKKNVPGWLYKGLFSTKSWLLPMLFSRAIILWIMARTYGLDKLAPRLKEQSAKKRA